MTIKDQARKLKDTMKTRRTNPKATLKELQMLLNCKLMGRFEIMKTTKLYQQHGGEYCEYLEILVDHEPWRLFNARERNDHADLTIEELAQYFTPGWLVPAYGNGVDEVVKFVVTDFGWAVAVKALQKDGSYGPVRSHFTNPTYRDLLEYRKLNENKEEN